LSPFLDLAILDRNLKHTLMKVTVMTPAQQIANLRAALFQRDCTLSYVDDIQNGIIAAQNQQWVPLTAEQQAANSAAQ
jgi:hypothetical protein